jgi:hypothetical protein
MEKKIKKRNGLHKKTKKKKEKKNHQKHIKFSMKTFSILL